MSTIKKNGNVHANIRESRSCNLFSGKKYTRDDPYILTGTGKDIIVTTDNYTRVTPGKTYYLLCSCYPSWSPSHGYSEASAGKCILWLYLRKEYDPSHMGFDSPILFSASNMISDGVWKYTIPADYNMARLRLNTYSDGTNSVSTKFWDIYFIPEESYVGLYGPAMKLSNSTIVLDNIIEN